MQIILMEKVVNLGGLGDVVNPADGCADSGHLVGVAHQSANGFSGLLGSLPSPFTYALPLGVIPKSPNARCNRARSPVVMSPALSFAISRDV